jgi:GxxExxY protein
VSGVGTDSAEDSVHGARLAAIDYKGTELKQRYIPDFLCYDKIILEIKAVKQLTDEHRAQVLNYLKATGLRLGLLVNFGHYPKVEYERIIL